ncbi:MAG TPA: alpha/beta hydrolase [Caldimonas sp.]|nr:alpha/beta hydrolase [Caldimonas sp.]
MATFVIVHGAWSSAWGFARFRALLRARGHEVHTPTHTGLGERSHLSHPGIDLESHVADVLAVLQFEDLRDVVLVAHSYGGMVGTVVADRAADRVAQLIYLDAFVPRDGESCLDLQPPEIRSRALALANEHGDGWRVPQNPMPPDTPAPIVEWAVPRRKAQPLKTLQQPARIGGAVERLPRAYIYCTRVGPGDVFRRFAERARADPSWRYRELDASHNPHLTMPETLADLLDALARDPGAPRTERAPA